MEKHDCCHCSARRKERSPEEYKKLINRLSRIEGQIRGIRAMVENGAYCPDILVQSAAANAALNAFNKELLANHLRTCVAQDIRRGARRDHRRAGLHAAKADEITGFRAIIQSGNSWARDFSSEAGARATTYSAYV